MKYTNELINETSPYLREHAHNPVNWHAWNDQVFEKAKKENKPIFLSIGYSSCHWCHVMAKECFEDEEVAKTLNKEFLCIKVDREERPDVDMVYMQAALRLTGSGGWPLNIFMSADKDAFFAASYIPKKSFLNLLDQISKFWNDEHEKLVSSAKSITEAINFSANDISRKDAPSTLKALKALREDFDDKYGGCGMVMKFPMPHNLLFLLYADRSMAEKTLLNMARGGIFDHIGGGFFRYSTDLYWLIPHFEKMLYDNALLAYVYLVAYEITDNCIYKQTALKILGYMSLELKSNEGGFYTSQDADSQGEEGKYYLFEPEEIYRLFGKEQADHFALRYGITPKGNFEGKNLPNLIMTHDIEPVDDEMIQKAYLYRKTRYPLKTDNKILASSNSLALAAYAAGARILQDEKMMSEAVDIYNFIEGRLFKNSELYSCITEGKLGAKAFLDDYAFYIFALIELYHASLEDKYIERAVMLAEKAVDLFWDQEYKGFFFTSHENNVLPVRAKEIYDGAIFSGNSVMAYNLSRLCLIEDNDKLSEIMKKHSELMNGYAEKYPQALCFYFYSMMPVKKIIRSVPACKKNENFKARTNWVVVNKDGQNKEYPAINSSVTYYVCEGGRCYPPQNTLD